MIWWKYILVFFILVLSELVYFRLADKFNIIDKPNQRSSHTRITLRGGGVIFVFGMLLFFFFSGFEYYWFMIGLVAISVVAFIDDVHSVQNWLRLVVQFLAMGAMFHQMGLILEYPLWYIAVALILFVGIINAYNFMDGINGITGGYSLAVLLPLLYLDYSTTSPFIERSYLIIAIISVVIFNFFNFRTKAKCFAGDVGSVSIAFIILFALGMLILATGDVTYIVFLAVYGVDSVLTICHRILLREPLGKAHRKHLYQIMANELHIPHVCVSLVYMFVQLLISTGFVLLPVNHWLYLGITLGVLAVVYLLFMKKYYHLHREYLKSQNNDIMIIDDNLLDNVLSEASESPRKRMNFNIHKELTDPVQRLLNGLLPGTVLPVHRHPHTDETYVVLKGRMKVRFYSDEGDVDEEFLLDPSYGKYGVNIPKGRFHGVEVMEPTVIFEVKEGPYKQVDNIDLLNI